MMMDNMMDGGMWGMGVGGVILLVLVVLIIAALVKYCSLGEGPVRMRLR